MEMTRNHNKIRSTRADKAFDVVNYLFLGLVGLVTLYPLYFVLIASISEPDAVNSGQVIIYPRGFSLEGYERLFEDMRIWIGYRNTIFYIDENQNIRMGSFLMANYTFLDKLDMEIPSSLAEVEEYLRAATSKDLNGDGKNEIGLSFTKRDPNGITRLFSMFGVSWEPRTYLHYPVGHCALFSTHAPPSSALFYF